jgi:glycerol-3-phosphate acyltransferase PlsY
MNPFIAIAAILVGYLLGSISFTRILGRWFAPGEDLSQTEIKMSEDRPSFQMRSVSATSLAFRKGPKAGCLVSILDMLKAALPVLALRLYAPGVGYEWLCAAAAVVGHNFPIYYNFKGGRGMSPLYGGLFVLDWLAIPGTTLGGMVLGLVLGDVFLMWLGAIPLLLIWMILRFGTPLPIIYALIVNIAAWAAIAPELRIHLENRRQGKVEKINLRNYFRGAGNLFNVQPRNSNTDESLNQPEPTNEDSPA